MLRIKEIRKNKNLTQIQLASRLKITNVYLSYLEKGKRKPSFSLLERIAKELGVPIGELVGDKLA